MWPTQPRLVRHFHITLIKMHNAAASSHISTAPKDGTSILIFEAHVGTAGIVRVSRWRDDTIPSGWTGAENAPSHWLPLPLPPKRPRKFEASVVKDATGQSLAYDGRETRADADTARVLTMDEAHRIASNIAELPLLLKKE